jgi:hypothetical protein
MWTYLGKQIIIAINVEQIQCIQFDDGTEEKGFNAIKSFNRGIFVNPTLDRKKYLSLLKVFHPDISDLDSHLATQIAQTIINAKDGMATATSPWKTNHQSRSHTEAYTQSNSRSGSAKYNWADWAASSQNQSQRQSSHQQPKPPKVELDFETLLSCVPTNYWRMFGDFNTFERDLNVNFRVFKRCYYGYFDTELEIVFRQGCIFREKVTAIHHNFFYILHQLDLNSLTKSDLWTMSEHEAIAFNQFERKSDLLSNLKNHFKNKSHDSQNQLSVNPWTLMLTSSRPLWKHKFIYCDYHSNFKQSPHHHKSKQQKHQQTKAETSNCLNCGQYLKLKKQWLERDEFLYFLGLTRKLAKQLDIKTTIFDGYPAYPIHLLDLAWQKISL